MFLTQGLKVESLLASRPERLVGTFGEAPSPHRGPGVDAFRDAYDADSGYRLDSSLSAASFADSLYLMALALIQQNKANPGEPLGGAHLRDALERIAGPGGTSHHAFEWDALVSAIERGEDVDYEGISGPCDFDADHQVVLPREIFQVQIENSVPFFQQFAYFAAGAL